MKTCACMCIAIVLCAAVVGSAADLKGKSPEQVYEIYRKALKKDDVDTMMECASKRPEGEKTPTKAELKMALPMIKMMMPSDVKITKSDVKKSKATLSVEGEGVNPFTQKKDKTKGSVTFVKEGGVWKILKENWGSGSSQPGGTGAMPDQMDMGMDFKPITPEEEAELRALAAKLNPVFRVRRQS